MVEMLVAIMVEEMWKMVEERGDWLEERIQY